MKSMFALALVLGLFVPLHKADAQEPPPNLVEAIARQESGLNPLAVNVAGKSFYPATRDEAEIIIKAAQAAGKSYDVGLMQINSWWIDRYNIPAEKLLDPAFNAEWGKKILADEISRHSLNWQAVGKYHSPDTERGRRYAWRIYYHFADRSVSNIQKETNHAKQKTHSQNLPHPGGIQRNTGVSKPGRIITFDIQ